MMNLVPVVTRCEVPTLHWERQLINYECEMVSVTILRLQLECCPALKIQTIEKNTFYCCTAMVENREIQENEINHSREDREEVTKVNQVKIIVLDILLPLCDLGVDLTKAMMLVFDYQELKSLSSFANHFHTNGVYGIVSLLLKWAPSVVSILHFQDLNR